MNSIKTLTLVDDDEIFIFLTKKTIEQTKRVNLINVFTNGLDALNFLKQNRSEVDSLPEIILLDLNMPIMDGWQFLEAYTKDPVVGKKIMIYICSSSISPDDVARSKAMSVVSDYIIKPIRTDQLVELIDKL